MPTDSYHFSYNSFVGCLAFPLAPRLDTYINAGQIQNHAINKVTYQKGVRFERYFCVQPTPKKSLSRDLTQNNLTVKLHQAIGQNPFQDNVEQYVTIRCHDLIHKGSLIENTHAVCSHAGYVSPATRMGSNGYHSTENTPIYKALQEYCHGENPQSFVFTSAVKCAKGCGIVWSDSLPKEKDLLAFNKSQYIVVATEQLQLYYFNYETENEREKLTPIPHENQAWLKSLKNTNILHRDELKKITAATGHAHCDRATVIVTEHLILKEEEYNNFSLSYTQNFNQNAQFDLNQAFEKSILPREEWRGCYERFQSDDMSALWMNFDIPIDSLKQKRGSPSAVSSSQQDQSTRPTLVIPAQETLKAQPLPRQVPSLFFFQMMTALSGTGLLILACCLLPPLGVIGIAATVGYTLSAVSFAAGVSLLGLFAVKTLREPAPSVPTYALS